MKVGILGTRGIPNAYGGFEEFAQHLSKYLVEQGHEVFVYNSSLHPYKAESWEGVHIIHCRDMENRIGTAGQFIYDLNCIRDSRKRDFDILLQLGYTSSAIWSAFLPKQSCVITNMDGLEWKRSKFSGLVQRFLMWSERRAVKSSEHLVADSLGIQAHLRSSYNVESSFIAYGAEILRSQDESLLGEHGLQPRTYDMLIARMEPENNIEMILRAHIASKTDRPLLVIGDNQSSYSQYLRKHFKGQGKIQFKGAIYDKGLLNALRQHCRFYLHGHSVGGTNPSLLEAMGCAALVLAHDNPFNRGVLQEAGYYFASSEELSDLLSRELDSEEGEKRRAANRHRIESEYTWPMINQAYEALMKKLLQKADG